MSNLVNHAKNEFKILGWDKDEDEMQKMACENILELLEVFANQGHSGFSANYVLANFEKLARWKMISPLTGEEDEWGEPFDDKGTRQNKRLSCVFKDVDGTAYDSQGRVFEYPDGCTCMGTGSPVVIEFPYIQPDKPQVILVDKEGEPLDRSITRESLHMTPRTDI